MSESEPTFELIDRVAKALCMVENDDPGSGIYDALDENERNRYRHMAKAAIFVTRSHGQSEN